MREVWRHVAAVPYGRTASYRDVAVAAGNPKAVRAVGMANRLNPVPVFIPCHRIIGSDGKLTGYRGGLPLKERLLDLERCRCAGGVISIHMPASPEPRNNAHGHENFRSFRCLPE